MASFPLLLGFRVLNGLLVQTYYNPDEYWQSVEVAHEMAFGYGHKTWEWQEGARIRGYSHPLIFALGYKLLQFLGLDSPDVVAITPRLIQAIFAAVTDLFIYRFARRLFGLQVAQDALFASLVNWFMFYCMIRTFSNSIETCLSVIAFYYWPWDIPFSVSSRRLAVTAASLTFVLRPSSAVMWVILGLYHLAQLLRNGVSSAVKFVLEVLLIGSLFVVAGVCVDRYFYGVWTFVPFNFLQFNSLSGGSDLYGLNHWSYYFTEALPVMLFSLFPAFLMGLKHWGAPALLVLLVLLTYSFTGHKEYRFILPVFPIVIVYAAKGLSSIRPKWRRFAIIAVVCSNALAALYLSLIHQRAPISVLRWLSAQENLGSVVVLAGCHSTPHYSLFHRPNVPLTHLDCSPSKHPQSGVLTLEFTESKDFLRDPLRFVTTFFDIPDLPFARTRTCSCSEPCLSTPCCALFADELCAPMTVKPSLPNKWLTEEGVQTLPATNLTWWGTNWRRVGLLALPSHIVVFDRTRPALLPFLHHCGYRHVTSFTHAWVSDEGNNMEVWELQKSE